MLGFLIKWPIFEVNWNFYFFYTHLLSAWYVQISMTDTMKDINIKIKIQEDEVYM